MARYTKTALGTQYASKQQLDVNLNDIATAISDSLSRKGDSPNAMEADLDMDSNDILNVKALDVESLSINGTQVTATGAVTTTLPAQATHSGKYLTTNGTTASWATVDTIPTQTSNGGKQLQTNGTALSWVDSLRSFNTIALAKAATLSQGQYIATKGYTTAGDGGAGIYEVVPSSTGTVDGGEFHDLDDASGQLKLIHNGRVSVKQFGAVGDDATDDTTALKNANKCSASYIYYPPGDYYCPTETIPFLSNKTYEGVFEQSNIRSDTDAQPVAASRAYLTADGAVSPTGRCVIRNITFAGSSSASSQIAFVLHDFYCIIENCFFQLAGGGGLHLHHKNDAGTAASGTLVENRIVNCTVRNCGGILLDLGDADNAKLTDGFIEGVILDGQTTATATTQYLFCGSAAGWQMDGIHCYGATPSYGMEIQNANNTRITDIFMEAFQDRGINMPKIQGDVVVSGQFNANSCNANAYVTVLDKSGSVTNISGQVDIAVSLDVNTAGITCVRNLVSNADLKAEVRTQGPFKGNLVRVTDNATDDQVRILEDVRLHNATFDDRDGRTTTSIDHNGIRMAYGYSSQRLSGSGAQTVTIPVKLQNFAKLAGTITIEANANDNGANTARYHGMFYVSAKTNGTDAWVATLTSILGPTGFAVNPAITATNTGGAASPATGTVDITFTFTNATDTGVCVVHF